MINLIITIFGGVLLIVGFYSMYLGFLTPPNLLFFFMGLCLSVLGLVFVVLAGSKLGTSGTEDLMPQTTVNKKLTGKKTKKSSGNKVKIISKDEQKQKKLEKIEQAIKPKVGEKSGDAVGSEKTPITTLGEAEKMEEKSEAKEKEKSEAKEKKIQKGLIPIKPQKKGPGSEDADLPPDPALKTPQNVEKDLKIDETSPEKEKPKKPVSKTVAMEKLKAAKSPEKEDEYVKKRLDRLKENYMKNAKDIESVIDERLDSFKGTLGKLKSQSQEPGIIWSFDARDVQEAMEKTISKAKYTMVMMYPWVRNIDVNVLKKFMDIQSRMIIQEASLDDDASVELLRLLIKHDVKIRTMPHVHTVAVVADDDNGLIISTDPIYESYEVGVIYKDRKSIEEIKNLFEDAWNLSKDIDLEIK
jgi:hypothetical protein